MARRQQSSRGFGRLWPSGGLTLMIVHGPSRQTRRVRVSRWAIAVLCLGWLGAMLMAGWLGFRSAAPGRQAAADQGGARMATAPRPTSRQ